LDLDLAQLSKTTLIVILPPCELDFPSKQFVEETKVGLDEY
jgi:hypothetical protein